MELTSKTALITGASRGIGAAIALEFAQAGVKKICLNYHPSNDYEPDAEANVNKLLTKLEQLGVEPIALQADISNPEDVNRLASQSIEHLGKLDILVNNAGIVFDLPVADRTEDQWDRTINTNLKGTYLVSKAFAPYLKENPGSTIINIASNSGLDVLTPDSIDYDASKQGVIALTKNFAQELAPSTTVNAIAPGWVDTEMNKDLPKDFVDKELAKICLGRFAKPEEIANIAVFLASSASSYISGSVIIADGGRRH